MILLVGLMQECQCCRSAAIKLFLRAERVEILVSVVGLEYVLHIHLDSGHSHWGVECSPGLAAVVLCALVALHVAFEL